MFSTCMDTHMSNLGGIQRRHLVGRCANMVATLMSTQEWITMSPGVISVGRGWSRGDATRVEPIPSRYLTNFGLTCSLTLTSL